MDTASGTLIAARHSFDDNWSRWLSLSVFRLLQRFRLVHATHSQWPPVNTCVSRVRLWSAHRVSRWRLTVSSVTYLDRALSSLLTPYLRFLSNTLSHNHFFPHNSNLLFVSILRPAGLFSLASWKCLGLQCILIGWHSEAPERLTERRLWQTS